MQTEGLSLDKKVGPPTPYRIMMQKPPRSWQVCFSCPHPKRDGKERTTHPPAFTTKRGSRYTGQREQNAHLSHRSRSPSSFAHPLLPPGRATTCRRPASRAVATSYSGAQSHPWASAPAASWAAPPTPTPGAFTCTSCLSSSMSLSLLSGHTLHSKAKDTLLRAGAVHGQQSHGLVVQGRVLPLVQAIKRNLPWRLIRLW